MLGVTFKPNTDDMRDAPSLIIVPMLQERGATVRAYDPQGGRMPSRCCQASSGARARLKRPRAPTRVVLTEWNEFRAVDLKR